MELITFLLFRVACAITKNQFGNDADSVSTSIIRTDINTLSISLEPNTSSIVKTIEKLTIPLTETFETTASNGNDFNSPPEVTSSEQSILTCGFDVIGLPSSTLDAILTITTDFFTIETATSSEQFTTDIDALIGFMNITTKEITTPTSQLNFLPSETVVSTEIPSCLVNNERKGTFAPSTGSFDLQTTISEVDIQTTTLLQIPSDEFVFDDYTFSTIVTTSTFASETNSLLQKAHLNVIPKLGKINRNSEPDSNVNNPSTSESTLNLKEIADSTKESLDSSDIKNPNYSVGTRKSSRKQLQYSYKNIVSWIMGLILVGLLVTAGIVFSYVRLKRHRVPALSLITVFDRSDLKDLESPRYTEAEEFNVEDVIANTEFYMAHSVISDDTSVLSSNF